MKMRDDVVKVENLQKEVTRNAPGAEDGFYVVPKVVE
jgi:aspartyl-tRNA(Asn)/glutamyl-tRNA(Gln) amidotransferase subunit C